MLAGAVAGASTGAIGGPLGLAMGAVLGTAIGASSGIAMEFMEAAHRIHDEQLDRDIGVVDGDIGAGSVLSHPPPSMGGLFSAAIAGVSSMRGSHPPAEGPMQELD